VGRGDGAPTGERDLMNSNREILLGAGLADRVHRSSWPARLDLAQSASGLILVLFMWAHMFFVASILVSRDVMWKVTKFFEGYFFFGQSHPVIVSAVVAVVCVLFIGHALLAMRKFPVSYRQFGTYCGHMHAMQHEDTTLWFWQVFTGFAMFFLASVHLYLMLTRADRIGPFESADRVWSDHLWPLYLLLLLSVEFHGGIGLYRLAVKWGLLGTANPNLVRRRLKTLKWSITVFFLALGLATLAAYIKIGIEHRDHYGERYLPAPAQAEGAR
jgi:fumarate reductase subunit C